MSRQDSAGREVGEEYQNACISSWHQLGLQVFSVNSNAELTRLPRLGGVQISPVDPDASTLTGRPLVYVEDMLRVAREVSHGKVVITNSDILLGDDIKDALELIRPGSCLLGKRLEIGSLSALSGAPSWAGYDFFGMHVSDLQDHNLAGFVLGMPCWEYALPIYWLTRGLQVYSIKFDGIYHLRHPASWKFDMQLHFHRLFAEFFLDTASDFEASSVGNKLCEFNQKLLNKPDPAWWRLRSKANINRQMGKIIQRTVHFIDEMSVSLTQPVRMAEQSQVQPLPVGARADAGASGPFGDPPEQKSA